MLKRRRQTFRGKLLRIMLGIMVLWWVIYSVFYGIAMNLLQRTMISYSEAYVDYINSSLTSMVEDIDRISMTFLLQNDMIKKLGARFMPDSEEYMRYNQEVHEAIKQALNIRMDAESILIADSQGCVITDGPNISYLEGSNLSDETWYQQVMESESMFFFLPLHKTSVSEVFSVVRKLRSYEKMQVNGMIRIDMKKSLLDKICSKKIFSKSSVALFDSNRELFYLSGEKLGEDELEAVKNQLRMEPCSCQVGNGRSSLDVSAVYSDYLDIYIVHAVPQDVLMGGLKGLTWFAVLLIVLAGGVGIVLAAVASRAMARNVCTVMEGMRRIENGDLDTEIQVDTGDEIHTIADGLNHMVKRIKILMEEKVQLEGKKKEAEMIMLQRQIRPHFLYNTLDGIRMKALINQDYEVENMIEKLSLLLRRSTDTKTEFATVREEIEYVTYYVDLQNMRFRCKFQLTIQVEEAVMPRMIPKFCLQPLVENAIHHGLEKRKLNRRICISTEMSGDRLYLSVADNGEGIDRKRLVEIQENLNRPDMLESEHVGLNNIHMRLKLYYGPEFGLTIDSKEQSGTVVRLCLPPEEEKREEAQHVQGGFGRR